MGDTRTRGIWEGVLRGLVTGPGRVDWGAKSWGLTVGVWGGGCADWGPGAGSCRGCWRGGQRQPLPGWGVAGEGCGDHAWSLKFVL